MTNSIFAPFQLGPITLQNHIVMAPMTRSRAVENNAPNALIATFYAQRATAGLLITEGTSPSPNGLGYSRIPGLFSEAQVAGWSEVARAVHAAGGKIFVQLMHTGRVSHPLNLPAGAEVLAPSAVRLDGTIWTDQQQLQPYPTPRAMTTEEVQTAIAEYATAAKNAVRAGCDGVELHGANGYLIEQFINPHTNQRTDRYGGSVENRIRFALEVAKACADAIGSNRVGIRVSPYGAASGMTPYPEVDATYAALSAGLSKLGLIYIHVVDHSAMGAPNVPDEVKAIIRKGFTGVYIAAGGLDTPKAQALLDSKAADLVAFGRPFISNPDLVARMKNAWPLTAPVPATFYTPGAAGYTDYPAHSG